MSERRVDLVTGLSHHDEAENSQQDEERYDSVVVTNFQYEIT